MKKLRVGVIVGGKSAEHEVSLASSRYVIQSLDRSKYDVVVVGIDREGRWHVRCPNTYLTGEKVFSLVEGKEEVVLSMAEVGNFLQLDVALPVIHGPLVEDGALQGFLKMVGVPFVGADVLGSAIAMDKDVTKRLLREAGLPVAPCVVMHRYDRGQWSYERVCELFAPPFFVKPASLGSSIATCKVRSLEEFDKAIEEAFIYDKKVIIEAAITGKEIECAVIGNEDPKVSIPAEIEPHHEFYSYEAKYLDPHGSTCHIPAKISPACTAKVQELAKQVYRVLCCEGLARVDFFVTPDEEIFVNELNTLPGFRQVSVFPRLWEARGVSASQVLDQLIDLAVERHIADGLIASKRRLDSADPCASV